MHLRRASVFHQALAQVGRAFPDYRRHQREEGPFRGIAPPTVHPWIFAACNDEDGINVNTYEALCTRITLDGLLDILEMKSVRGSWSHAELLNQDWIRDVARVQREALGAG